MSHSTSPTTSSDVPTLVSVPDPGAGIGRWVRITLGIGMALAGVVLFGRYVEQALPPTPLPFVALIKGDLEATERMGQTVKLSALRGKVTVMACLYTVCPHGCAAIVAQMQRLNADFGSRADFHQVSLAVAPERDTAGFLKAYAEGVGVAAADPWWFVTGGQGRIWDYMTQELQLQPPTPIPEEKRINPLDLYEHDLRMVLIDRLGRVRGYYSVFHPQREIAEVMQAKLYRDVQTLLENPHQ